MKLRTILILILILSAGCVKSNYTKLNNIACENFGNSSNTVIDVEYNEGIRKISCAKVSKLGATIEDPITITINVTLGGCIKINRWGNCMLNNYNSKLIENERY